MSQKTNLTPLNEELLSKVNEYVKSKWPEEAIVFVDADANLHFVENIAEDKLHTFKAEPSALVELNPVLIIHSHTVGFEVITDFATDPRSPSKADLAGQIATDVEWCIIATDGENCDEPVYWGNPNNRPPLLGRDFLFNCQDCLSLAQDWYYQTLGIELPNKARDAFWNFEGENHIVSDFESFGFVQIPIEEAGYGDALIYQVRSDVPNHIGIHLGGNKVLSHWYGRVSAEEDYGTWARYISMALRHKSRITP